MTINTDLLDILITFLAVYPLSLCISLTLFFLIVVSKIAQAYSKSDKYVNDYFAAHKLGLFTPLVKSLSFGAFSKVTSSITFVTYVIFFVTVIFNLFLVYGIVIDGIKQGYYEAILLACFSSAISFIVILYFIKELINFAKYARNDNSPY
jgi:hypothetical protein